MDNCIGGFHTAMAMTSMFCRGSDAYANVFCASGVYDPFADTWTCTRDDCDVPENGHLVGGWDGGDHIEKRRCSTDHDDEVDDDAFDFDTGIVAAREGFKDCNADGWMPDKPGGAVLANGKKTVHNSNLGTITRSPPINALGEKTCERYSDCVRHARQKVYQGRNPEDSFETCNSCTRETCTRSNCKQECNAEETIKTLVTHYVEVVDDENDENIYRAVLQAGLDGAVLEADVALWLTGDAAASANIAVLSPFKYIAGGYLANSDDGTTSFNSPADRPGPKSTAEGRATGPIRPYLEFVRDGKASVKVYYNKTNPMIFLENEAAQIVLSEGANDYMGYLNKSMQLPFAPDSASSTSTKLWITGTLAAGLWAVVLAAMIYLLDCSHDGGGGGGGISGGNSYSYHTEV